MQQIVVAVRRIETRRGGVSSGIIRRGVLRDSREFGLVDGQFVGIRDAVLVVMRVPVLRVVRVPVLRMSVLVLGVMIAIVIVVRDGTTVGVRRDPIVQTEMQVRRELDAEYPERDRQPRHHMAVASDRSARGGHGRREYSRPAGRPDTAASLTRHDLCRIDSRTPRSHRSPPRVPRTTPR